MTELIFVNRPEVWCNWIVYPCLLAGDRVIDRPTYDGRTIDEYVTLEDIDPRRDESLTEKIHTVSTAMRSNKTIYLYDRGDYRLIKTFLLCFVQSWFRCGPEASSNYVESCLTFRTRSAGKIVLTKAQINQVKRYRRPLTVLVCGDRDSSVCFEEMINFELKMLPKYSIIVHGGCKGVDLYAAELAKLSGFETRDYPAEWHVFGRAAGPKRNQEMLNRETIDMVLAFHPDISTSRGTKNMMVLGHAAGIPVYIHDLKRKMKFEGDFDVL